MTRPLRLLVVSYYFPPAGGPAVHRIEMLLRHLPPEVSTTVVTAALEDYQQLSPLSTPLDLQRPVPSGAVQRVPAGCPYGLFRALARGHLYGAVRWCYVPDVARNWARAAVRAAVELHRQEPFDLVLSTAPPFSAALAGRDCARALSIPWISDLRDLWTECILYAWPTAFHWRRERALEAAVLREATTTILVTPGSRDRMLRRYPQLNPDRFACVTNGYARGDFPAATPARETFVVAHTGVFNGADRPESRLRSFVHGRSFHPRQLDRTAHSPATIIRAMEQLNDPRIEFRQIGPMSGGIQDLFNRSAVRGRIRVLGIRDRCEALAELASADAAFLCLTSIEDDPRNELVPLKTYEYLGARKPVLAAIQDGDAKDILAGAGLGFCTPPGDDAAHAQALRSLADAKFQGRQLVAPREDFLRRFEWTHLAKQYGEILDRAASRRPAPELALKN